MRKKQVRVNPPPLGGALIMCSDTGRLWHVSHNLEYSGRYHYAPYCQGSKTIVGASRSAFLWVEVTESIRPQWAHKLEKINENL